MIGPYPEQVRQSQVIFDAIRTYAQTAILTAAKGTVSLDDLFRLISATRIEAIPRLRQIAAKYQFDAAGVLAFFKQRGKGLISRV